MMKKGEKNMKLNTTDILNKLDNRSELMYNTNYG